MESASVSGDEYDPDLDDDDRDDRDDDDDNDDDNDECEPVDKGAHIYFQPVAVIYTRLTETCNRRPSETFRKARGITHLVSVYQPAPHPINSAANTSASNDYCPTKLIEQERPTLEQLMRRVPASRPSIPLLTPNALKRNDTKSGPTSDAMGSVFNRKHTSAIPSVSHYAGLTPTIDAFEVSKQPAHQYSA